jgi:uncharacterized protein
MNIKRIILSILTVISLLPVFVALLSSLNEAQVQTDLQIYITNATLHTSEVKLENFVQNSDESLKYLIGDDPYVNAQKEYQKAKKVAENNLVNLKNKQAIFLVEYNSSSAIQLEKEIDLTKRAIDRLNINLGIIETQLKNLDSSFQIWNDVIIGNENSSSYTATILKGLWSKPSQVLDNAEAVINDNLKGWFRYKALEKLYQVQNRPDDLLLLQNREQEIAMQLFVKLVLMNALPLLGGATGFGLLIFLLIKLLINKKESLLGSINTLSWQTPWDGETIWQVLIAGFFFVGQIVLPLIFVASGIKGANLSLREQAVYVLISYILLAAVGLSVLYFSIKSFFPLPQDWFRFQWLSNWVLWGIGGYLVALPLVFFVSFLNQSLWHGKGGSNPLLFLALEAQDKVVLAIFFFTASIAAPIFEEILFRGFLLPSLTRYVPVWGAIIISSVIFAIAHLNLSELLPLATLGIILGVVYVRSRNLLASILLHSLWNSGTLLSLFVLGSSAS